MYIILLITQLLPIDEKNKLVSRAYFYWVVCLFSRFDPGSHAIIIWYPILLLDIQNWGDLIVNWMMLKLIYILNRWIATLVVVDFYMNCVSVHIIGAEYRDISDFMKIS